MNLREFGWVWLDWMVWSDELGLFRDGWVGLVWSGFLGWLVRLGSRVQITKASLPQRDLKKVFFAYI